MFPRISPASASGERAALVENLDAVADAHDQRHVVVDEEHARVVLVAHRADDLRERRNLGLRKSGGGLVHEDEARLGGERACDPEPPLVAVRKQPAGASAYAPSWSDSSSASARRRASRGACADAERGHLDVLAHGEALKRAAVLERP